MGDEYTGDSEEEDAVSLLNKAISSQPENPLNKAGNGGGNDDGGDDDDYDEEYMKKYMKRFMKNNKEYMGKYMKKAADFGAEVIDEFNSRSQELEDAEAVLVDGTDMFKAYAEFTQNMLKAFTELHGEVESLRNDVAYGNEINKAAGQVLIKADKVLGEISKQPNSAKGVQHMQKAAQATGGAIQPNNNGGQAGEGQGVLQKAQSLGVGGAKQLLIKAMQDGNQSAGRAITELESCGGNMARLPQSTLHLISNLHTAAGGGQ